MLSSTRSRLQPTTGFPVVTEAVTPRDTKTSRDGPSGCPLAPSLTDSGPAWWRGHKPLSTKTSQHGLNRIPLNFDTEALSPTGLGLEGELVTLGSSSPGAGALEKRKYKKALLCHVQTRRVGGRLLAPHQD